MRLLRALTPFAQYATTEVKKKFPSRYAGVVMTKRWLSGLSILVVLNVPTARARTIRCKTPELAASCYMTHGRLAVYNGSTNWRLWKIGTNNLLGIFSGPQAFKTRYDTLDGEDPELPPNLKRAFDVPNPVYEVEVYADFEVCPLERHIEGHMQSACIENVTHLFVKHFNDEKLPSKKK